MKRKYVWCFIKKISDGIICSFAMSFLLFIYAPLEIYLTNKNDFWLDFYTLTPFLLRMFCAFGVICVFVLSGIFCIKIQLYRIVLSILFAVFIASYIQGTFLSSGLPPLDGRNIDWSSYQPQYRASVILWSSLCIVSVITLKKMKFSMYRKVIISTSIFISAILCSSLVILFMINNGFYGKNKELATVKNQFEMSAEQNFIILLFDAVDAGMFSNLLEEDPEYQSVFQDFTYYDNAMCAYPFTMMSIPFILSGEWYENETSFDFYLSEAVNESPLFHSLEEQNFKIGIYDSGLNLDNHSNRFDNVTNTPAIVTSNLEFAYAILQLSGIKYAPFFLKPACYGAPVKINNLKAPERETGEPFYRWENTTFFADIQNAVLSFTDRRVFKFIHLEGAHVPYQYNKKVEIIENGTYRQNVEACITIASVYLEKLKNNHVYDNSVIIIMADHGYGEGNTNEGRQHPFFLVKGRNEAHELSISHAPISYDDLQDAYERLLLGKNGNDIFDYREGDQRERRFLFYRYTEDAHMEEYLQHGNAADLTTLIPTGRVFDR